MLKILLSLVIAMSSFALLAGERQYVACTNDPHEYNVLMEIESNRVFAYSINDSKWSDEVEVALEDHEMGVLYIEWAFWNDTANGYSVYLNKDLLNNWKVVNWTSGNDADNYGIKEDDEQVYCHLLKSKPESTLVRAVNIKKVLQ